MSMAAEILCLHVHYFPVWLRKKVQGAVAHCDKQKLYKKCPYEGVRKYLVQTSDKVECLSCIVRLEACG